MQAIIEAKQLQQAVKQAGKVAGKRSSMPILEAIRIDADSEGLTISATDLDAWGCSTVKCLTQTDAGPNSVLVSASLLAKLTGKLSGEVLLTAPNALEQGEGVLTIGGSVIPTMTLEDYPEMPASVDGLHVGTFEGAAFKGLVRRLKAASKKGSPGQPTYSQKTGYAARLSLYGVNVIYGAGRVKFAATDGHRLLVEEYAADCSESGTVLVDASELARIATLVKAADVVTLAAIPGDPDADWSGDKVARLVVSFASARYTLRGINEEFPDFERVIPKHNHLDFTVNRKAFLAAIQRGMIVADRMSGGIMFELEEGSSILQLSSNSRELGSYNECIRHDGDISGDCEPVSFNGALLEDVCKLGKSPSVSVALGGRLDAARFSTDSDNVPGRISQAWVLMPVNIS